MKKITQQVSRTVERWEALDGTVFDTRGECEKYEETHIRKPAEEVANTVERKFVRFDVIEQSPSDTSMFLLFHPRTENEIAAIKKWMWSMQCWLEVENVTWDKIRMNSIIWFGVEVEYNSSLEDLSCVCDVYSYEGTTEDVICGYVRRVEKCAKELTEAI